MESEQIITRIETDGSDHDCYENLNSVKNFMIKNARSIVALYSPGNSRREKP